MGPSGSRAVVLDAGALIAIERGDIRVMAVLGRLDALHVPAGALAQVWRDPERQVRLARAMNLEGIVVHALDEDAAKAAGLLCARAGTADVVDASVVEVARRLDGTVITSDPEDIARLGPELRIAAI